MPCACHFHGMVQVVVAISGFYVGLYVVCKGISALFSSPKKKEVGEKSRQKGTHCFTCKLECLPTRKDQSLL